MAVEFCLFEIYFHQVHMLTEIKLNKIKLKLS